MKSKKILPPTYLLLSIVLMVALRFPFPVMTVVPFPWNLLGTLPLVLGAIINVMADRAFKLAHTTVKPFQESSALITGGVFRFTRNPMYLGFLLILIGIAVLLESLTPFVVVPVFAVLLDRLYIVVEERMLAAKFGVKWQEYRQNTRRWL